MQMSRRFVTYKLTMVSSLKALLTFGTQVRFGQIKRKLGLNTDTAPRRAPAVDGATPTKVKKAAAKKGAKRGKVIKNDSDGDEDMPDDGSESPISPVKEENYEL